MTKIYTYLEAYVYSCFSLSSISNPYEVYHTRDHSGDGVEKVRKKSREREANYKVS